MRLDGSLFFQSLSLWWLVRLSEPPQRSHDGFLIEAMRFSRADLLGDSFRCPSAEHSLLQYFRRRNSVASSSRPFTLLRAKLALHCLQAISSLSAILI
jgi:hypothetical protein